MIISFGGAAGGEPAEKCTSVSNLEAECAGRNDDNENFTQSNASTLEGFARSNGVGELSFWEVDGFDKTLGYAYTKIFTKITG